MYGKEFYLFKPLAISSSICSLKRFTANTRHRTQTSLISVSTQIIDYSLNDTTSKGITDFCNRMNALKWSLLSQDPTQNKPRQRRTHTQRNVSWRNIRD